MIYFGREHEVQLANVSKLFTVQIMMRVRCSWHFLPFVVRGIGFQAFDGILTDKDVDLILTSLASYRPKWYSIS